MNDSVRFLVLLVALLLVFPTSAMAYLDPITGSMVLQMAVGGLLAGVAIVKVYWHKIRSIFTGRKDNES